MQYINKFKIFHAFFDDCISMIVTLCLDLLPLDVFRVGIGHQGVNGVLSYGHLHLISGRLIFMGAHTLMCSCNSCCHGNLTINSFCIVVKLHAALNSIKLLSDAMAGILLRCC